MITQALVFLPLIGFYDQQTSNNKRNKSVLGCEENLKIIKEIGIKEMLCGKLYSINQCNL